MKMFSVIGAGYGDEGKGLAVDAKAHDLLSEGEVTVVRVNGGAQAGHTVHTPEGARHVFHQIGAGSFAGARTHWACGFAASPMFWAEEKAEVAALGGRVDAITADPRVLITTPWDIMINQFAEQARGEARHGSCGMGFGETVERSESGWGLTMADLADPKLWDRLDLIRSEWVPRRLVALGIDPDPHAALVLDEGILAAFLEDILRMRNDVAILPDTGLRDPAFGQILTEGAQGLGLDMDVGAFPHVTRSHTGLRNVMRLARDLGASMIETTYMTRAYGTRHGAGPFAGEGNISAWAEVVDPTNAPNGWQGRIRTGVLHLDEMRLRMDRDLAAADAMGISVLRKVGVSCLDQVVGEPQVFLNGRVITSLGPEFIANALGGPLGLCGSGPHREAVEIIGRKIRVPDLMAV